MTGVALGIDGVVFLVEAQGYYFARPEPAEVWTAQPFVDARRP